MTRQKQIKDYAKGLLKIASENGELSEERVVAVLHALEKKPPRNYAHVLKVFLKLVQRELANRTAEVEYAGALSDAAISSIQSNLSTAYGRSISVKTSENPALIAGVRVRVGCDVYESSIAGALRELEISLS